MLMVQTLKKFNVNIRSCPDNSIAVSYDISHTSLDIPQNHIA